MISFVSLSRQRALCSDDGEMPYVQASDTPATGGKFLAGGLFSVARKQAQLPRADRAERQMLLSEPYSLQLSSSCGLFLCVRRIGPSLALWSVQVAGGREKGCEDRAAVQQPHGKIEMWLGGTSARAEFSLGPARAADPSVFASGRRDLDRGCPVGGEAIPVCAFGSPRRAFIRCL